MSTVTISLASPPPAENGVMRLDITASVPEPGPNDTAAISIAPVRSAAHAILRDDEAFQKLARARAQVETAKEHREDLSARLKALQDKRAALSTAAPAGLAKKLRELDEAAAALPSQIAEAGKNVRVLEPVVVSLGKEFEQRLETVVSAEMNRVEGDLRSRRAGLLRQLAGVAAEPLRQLALVEAGLAQVAGAFRVQTREGLRSELASWKADAPHQSTQPESAAAAVAQYQVA